ncbi:MAG: site-2 protease family protein, partial [Rickettsiales bacterium]|nr:site-2 protease family protein [Rickettsiales bacterium]
PIPLLDGGHVVVNFIEFITRRRVSNKVYKAMVYVGIVIITLLMGLGFFNDIFVNR